MSLLVKEKYLLPLYTLWVAQKISIVENKLFKCI